MLLSGSTLQTHFKFDFDYIAMRYLLSYPGPYVSQILFALAATLKN